MWCPRTESNRGPIDYKSIALPAELQGHSLINQVFSLKDQLNQSIINPVSVRCLLAAHSIIVSCSLFVTDLSVWSRSINQSYPLISNLCFHPLKITKQWSGNHEQEFKIYSSSNCKT